MITPEIVRIKTKWAEKLFPLVTSVEDMVFGFIIGEIESHFGDAVKSNYGRDPTIEDFAYLAQIIQRRAPEIKRACQI